MPLIIIPSSHVQVLVALASDLGLDSLATCLEAHKWTWFRRYCMAARVAKALEDRQPMPTAFTEEVMKKVQEISAEGEALSHDHEAHHTFHREHDEQLLLWLNRSAGINKTNDISCSRWNDLIPFKMKLISYLC